ncbi:ATP-binding cassette domain-containing protein [Sodalis sp. dw_96]|uniref:ATP-binding cassette domain-containing protein n=1 Tax=Sodalis sp. dw_96 TaxID=2719794 RepID=UPI001BD2818A|nr:ATP-binding cassette domain-containing protein [Sodalis sp. dw_96]
MPSTSFNRGLMLAAVVTGAFATAPAAEAAADTCDKTYTQEVLKGVDLHLKAGEVHALLGPNGAAKSTLLGCVSGAITPDSGEMIIGKHLWHSFTPKSAFETGTAIIYQHFQLIGSLTISDNIFLGNEMGPR